MRNTNHKTLPRDEARKPVDKISEQDYEQIAATINSDASPVGIDAKKTHVLILHLLDKIEKRLERLEAHFDKLDSL